MNFQGRDLNESEAYRSQVLGLIRYGFSPERPLFVGRNVMRECLNDPDLAALVADRHIVETPMIPH